MLQPFLSQLLEEKGVAIIRQVRQFVNVICHPDMEEWSEPHIIVTKG